MLVVLHYSRNSSNHLEGTHYNIMMTVLVKNALNFKFNELASLQIMKGVREFSEYDNYLRKIIKLYKSKTIPENMFFLIVDKSM